MEALIESIKKFGELQPIIIDKEKPWELAKAQKQPLFRGIFVLDNK